jgi:GrpB-like predicted nucleotidyltransferase (UPF0157 family)
LYGKINAANPLAAFIQEVKTMIEIVPYKPSWPVEFVQIASQLRSALGELALRIDHIGSTSVPGLDAKDIIDIQLTVSSFDDFQPVQSALDGIGFTLNPDYVRDHRPPGAQGPASDWESAISTLPEGSGLFTCTCAPLAARTSSTHCCFVTTCALTPPPQLDTRPLSGLWRAFTATATTTPPT